MTDPDRVPPARVGPKATEDEESAPARGNPGLTLRSVLPSVVTAAAMCAGLTGIRFAVEGAWALSVALVVLAGVLDGIDGRVARMMNAQSRFGAELDSLADSLSFGMAPALILYLWALNGAGSLGWLAALAFAIACALRLARFNAQIDVDEQPHKSAGFLTGVPAPVGAGLVFLPIYLWLATGEDAFRSPWIATVWAALIAVLMISNIATLSWGAIRPRRSVRLELIGVAALVFGALLLEPWWALTAICVVYLALMPWALWRYAKVRRQRAMRSSKAPAREPLDVTDLPE